MKKFFGTIFLVVAIFSCMFLSSCKNKYDDLTFSFYKSGETISSVELIKGDNEKSQITLSVKLDGIKSEEVGNIEVYSSIANLVNVPKSEISYQDNMCFFKVYALNASKNDAQLIVKHLASNKTASINLNVYQDATSATLEKSKCVIDIPEENEAYYLNSSNLINLNPAFSTNQIVYEIKSGIINDENLIKYKTTNKIVGFNLASGLKGKEITLTPYYIKTDGTEVKISGDVAVKFLQLDNSSSLKMTSLKHRATNLAINATLDTNYIDEQETFYLIQNDASNNKLMLNFNFENIGTNWVYYYDVEIDETSTSLAVVKTIDNGIIVQAVSNTDDVENVCVHFVPKDEYAGDLKEITKQVKVKGVSVADKIEVLKANELIDTTNIVNIYDYYETGSSLGAMFNFKTKVYGDFEILSGFDKMQLEIPKGALYTAINQIYADEKLSGTPTDADNYQKYALEFHIETRAMKFYLSSDGEYYISEPISSADRIFIKYVTTNKLDLGISLSLTARTINSSTLAYLQWVNTISDTINFDARDSVKAFDLKFGHVETNERKEYSSVDLNEVIYIDVSSNVIYQFYFNENGLLDLNGNSVASAELMFRIVAKENQTNPLRILHLDRFDDGNESDYSSSQSQVEYSYQNNATSCNQSIWLALNDGDDNFAEVGYYDLIVEQKETGSKRTISLYLYRPVDFDNLDIDVEHNDNAFKNVNYVTDYHCDYISTSDNSITFTIDVDEESAKTYVTKYEFAVGIYTYDDGNYVLNSTASKDIYFSTYQENEQSNKLTLTLKNGTYIDGINYIKVDYKVYYKQFSATAFTRSADANESLSKSTKIYVYNQLNEDDLSISSSNKNLYLYSNLGAYNKSNATTLVSVNVSSSELWNYITKVDWNEDEYEDACTCNLEAGNNPKQCEFTFNGTSSTTVDVVVKVKQFEKEILLTETLIATNPISTSKLLMKGHFDYASNIPYVNLKLGGSYVIDAENYADGKNVTFSGYEVILCDELGNLNSKYYDYVSVEKIDGKYKLTCKKIDNELTTTLKVVVYSQDAMNCRKENIVAVNLSNPAMYFEDYIIENISDENVRNLYYVFDVILSDGTETNPYLINDADDFWEIASNATIQNKYFKVMNNIDLGSTTLQKQAIADFKGTLFTDGNQYTLYNIQLNNSLVNLFTTLSGSISNITFDANYDYNNTKDKLGVIGTNTGTLTNVSVVASGTATINKECDFGLLVAENEGTITYSTDLIGACGEITLSGDKKVNFGGLVGFNSGTISGKTFEHSVLGGSGTTTFKLSLNETGYASTVAINATGITNASSNIGGVVGKNESTIQYVKSSVKITGNVGNIGGVIGENITGQEDKFKQTLTFTGTDLTGLTVAGTREKVIYFVTSKATISGGTNVGGIVGKDTNGIYDDCQYQLVKNAKLSGTNAGGIAGYSSNGQFSNCAVMSYTTTDDYQIVGSTYAGGIVGLAVCDRTTTDSSTEINNTVIVRYSSVNANISGTNAGGILSFESNVPIIFNVYFIGNIQNNETTYKVTNNNNFLGHYYYSYANNSLNENGLTATIDSYYYWGQSAGVNTINSDNYIFITADEDGTKPIFDLAPTSLDVNLKSGSDFVYQVGSLEDTIYAYFYDFTGSTKDSEILSALQAIYNKKSLLEMFTFGYAPSGLSSLELKVSSSNPSVATISTNGELIILSTGECTLTFTSVLNESVSDEITLYVILPIGNASSFKVLDDLSREKVDGEYQVTMAVNESRKFEKYTYGICNYNDVDYIYKTLSNFGLDVTTDNSNIANTYYGISGQEFTAGKWSVDANRPFMLTIKEYTNTEFEIVVTPYVIMADTKITLTASFDFNLKIGKGATNVAIQNTESIIYPEDETYVTVIIDTDMELSADEVKALVYKLVYNKNNSNQAVETIEKSAFADMGEYLQFVEVGEFANNQQIAKFNLITPTPNGKETLNLTFRTTNGNNATIKFTILSQRINKLEIKNYVTKNDKLELERVLKPAKADETNAGLLIIDVVPSTGYFDYLEVADITGDEEIKFIQYKKFNTADLSAEDNEIYTNPNESSDGKGIQLTKVGSTYYVMTQISKDYTSKPHTIEVRAYVVANDVASQVYAETKTIEVKMLPSVTVEYRLPDGSTKATTTDKTYDSSTLYYANGTEATFYVSTANANGEVEYQVSKSNYKIEKGINGFYYLTCTSYSASDVGSEIQITWTTYDYADNGDYETTSASFKFTITNFVVHSVSVDGAIDNKISGNIGVKKDLSFYFSPTDISAYLSTGEWTDRTENFVYDSSIDNTNELYYINNVLKELQENPLTYLTLNFGKNASGDYIKTLDETEYIESDSTKQVYKKNSIIIAELTEDGLIVYDDYSDELQLSFDLKFKIDGNNFVVDSDGTIALHQDYSLAFTLKTSAVEPKLVATAKDFLNMSSGDQNYYILGDDITLSNYSPLDLDIAEFDGNGRTITIESFALSTDTTAYYGLFEQVYEGMIVKNVVVNYAGVYKDQINTLGSITNNEYLDLTPASTAVDYEAVYFAGIAPINAGIITNCDTTGEVAFRASVVEAKTEEYEIAFTMAGLVCENQSTGYITNSNASLSMYGQANIAGFVFENDGTIASSTFEDAYINAYNSKVSVNTKVKVSGFVYENTNKITMSCVNLDGVYNISSKDSTAGFVYSNDGTIKDCYFKMDTKGYYNNSFYGFVANNSGSVKNAYSIVNSGVKPDSETTMFASLGSTGLENCYTFVGTSNSSQDGLTTLPYAERFDKSSYKNFTFGDNKSAVWKIVDGSTPKLTSIVDEKVKYTLDETPTGEQVCSAYAKSKYYGLQNVTVEEVVGDANYTYKCITNAGTYGLKSNPILLHDYDMTVNDTQISTWEYYFDNSDSTSYYRIVADISFLDLGKNPNTSELEFSGNLQGNNMIISNILLKTDLGNVSTESVGLFKKLEGLGSVGVNNAVRNLTLKADTVLATKTSAVGVLAGIVENFNLYNITIDSPNLTVVGGNAVGGLAGVIRGKFDVQEISSNVSVNSAFVYNINGYSIYLSVADGYDVSYNLSRVYYAGSIAGILDGYTSTTSSSSYMTITNVSVSGKITAIADTVGGLFGYVGPKVCLENATCTLTGGTFEANQFAGALVGENHGKILNSSVTISDDEIFTKSKFVVGGLVGQNVCGLVDNASVKGNILMSITQNRVAGGIIGRNVEGYVTNVTYDGNLCAHVVGGIIGEDYTIAKLKATTYGNGTIADDCKASLALKVMVYTGYTNYSDWEIGENFETYYLTNIKKFFSHSEPPDEAINKLLSSMKVYHYFGLAVGVSYNDTAEYSLENYTISGAVSTQQFGIDNGYLVADNESTDTFSYQCNATGLDDGKLRVGFLCARKDDIASYICENANSKNIILFS